MLRFNLTPKYRYGINLNNYRKLHIFQKFSMRKINNFDQDTIAIPNRKIFVKCIVSLKCKFEQQKLFQSNFRSK